MTCFCPIYDKYICFKAFMIFLLTFFMISFLFISGEVLAMKQHTYFFLNKNFLN